MVEYVGMSVNEIYQMKCDELGCKKNSLLVRELSKTPDKFDDAKVLDLSKNFVGPKGLLPVLEVVRVSSGLRHLSLRDNQLTNQCVVNLMDVIQTHKGIRSIDLSSNPITIGAGKAILELTKTNEQIEEIYLDGTAVKEILLRAIDTQLGKNKLNMKPQEEATGEQLVDIEPTADLSASSIANLFASQPTTVHEILFDINPIEHIAALCREKHAVFSDPQFPPDWKSIQKSALKDYPVHGWVRLKETPKARLFPDTVSLSTLELGHLATSWLMESLNAVVMAGNLIEDLITPKVISPFGVYTVKLFIDGKWRWVVVDDWVPVDINENFVFARSKSCNSLWIHVIEKAVAKAHGSYQALDVCVNTTHPLEKAPRTAVSVVDFTGGVGIARDLHQEDFNPDEWWEEFTELSARNAHLVVTTSGKDQVKLAEAGLMPHHAYTVTMVRTVYGFRLLSLSSAFRESTWQGDWGDNSPLWEHYPDVAETLEFKMKPKDTFWMPYSSLLLHFQTIHIVKVFLDWPSLLLPGEWDKSSSGGPYFEQTWADNPRYKFTVQKSGKVFINLVLPDKRFATSDVDTLAFHILKADYYPVRYDKDNVVVKTPYLITNSVSFEGELEQGTYWVTPSTYVIGKMGTFNLRVLSESAFTLQRELLDKYWKKELLRSRWLCSGEYQNGEDHPQFELKVAASPDPVRVVITVEADKHEDNSLVTFVCAGKGGRMLGALSDDSIVVKSKYLIGSVVQLECQLPGGNIPYVVVPCLQPEGSRSRCTVTALCSTPNFSLTELPMWTKKQASGSWTSSSTYQDATNNPQFELVCPIANQQFVIKLEVTGHEDPSILFFVVDNNGRQGKGLTGLIPESQILCTSTYIRANSIAKDFTLSAPPSDSYLIIPTLQPPGSSANCKVSVSCPSDDYQFHSVFEF